MAACSYIAFISTVRRGIRNSARSSTCARVWVIGGAEGHFFRDPRVTVCARGAAGCAFSLYLPKSDDVAKGGRKSRCRRLLLRRAAGKSHEGGENWRLSGRGGAKTRVESSATGARSSEESATRETLTPPSWLDPFSNCIRSARNGVGERASFPPR